MSIPVMNSGEMHLATAADASTGKELALAVVDDGQKKKRVLLREDEEDLEVKLRRIMDHVPVRVNNTSGSSAGSGSGDFHQYRQMRRKEQDRIARMDKDYQKRLEVAEFELRREERLKEAEERTAKKRQKRLKKKERKKGNKKKNEVNNNDGNIDNNDDKNNDNNNDDGGGNNNDKKMGGKKIGDLSDIDEMGSDGDEENQGLNILSFKN